MVSSETLLYVAMLLLFPVALLTAAVIWLRVLQKKIRIKTRALQESEARFRTLVNDIPGAVCRYIVSNSERSIDFISDYILQITGYPPSDFIGAGARPFADVIHPDDRKILEDAVAEAISQSRPYALEYRILDKNGRIRWVDERGQGVLDEQGELRWIDSFIHDITEKKLAREALRQAEEKYRTIFENAVEGIYQASPRGYFLSVNPSLAKILGYESPEDLLSSVSMIGKELYVNPADCYEFERILQETDMITQFETRYYRKDGSVIWVSLTARTIRGPDGRALYYEGSLVNITKRRRFEEKLRRLNEELEERVNERTEELSRALSSVIDANKQIMDSIQYARLIQSSLLPNPENIKSHFPDSFFIFMPRDIVGGDFIFTDYVESGFIIGVIDCTGHGVPGAFMTLITYFGLRKIIRDEGWHDPAQILKRLNFLVQTILQQDTEDALSDDGLDAAICLISGPSPIVDGHLQKGDDEQRRTVTFSGANLPLTYIHKGKMHVIKGDRQSIGYKDADLNFDFTHRTVPAEKGMCFYLTTDGFVDQLGGEKNFSFGNKRFRKILRENSRKPFEEQKSVLLHALNEWQRAGKKDRQDDVTVVGFTAL
jgi:PAS domain S-box-containing protein